MIWEVIPNYFKDEKRCIRCGCCVTICPVDAIRMMPDEKGVVRPSYEKYKCIRCNRCTDACEIFENYMLGGSE